MKVISKVLSHLDRIDQLVWRVKQPITKKPSDPRSAVSDLFVWRKGQGWRTFFELTDIASLFGQSFEPTVARVLVFDQSGGFIGESTFAPPRYSRLQVDISKLATPCLDNVGTFCVLHSGTPGIITNLGSNLAERGYVSYCYGEPSLKSYVHGNLDAVSLTATGAIELLAGTSFLKREYRLQCDLTKGKSYDLVIVNASTKMQSVQCELVSTVAKVKTTKDATRLTHLTPGSRYHRFQLMLKPGACDLFQVNPSESSCDSVRVVIKSHLVMLRPIVFQIDGGQIDAFHG
jgi:hypothetical protein